MDTRPHATPDHGLAAEPWPDAAWLHRSEGFAEDLAPPAAAATPGPARRKDWGLGMVRRLERLTGTVIAASARPARTIAA